MRVTQSRQAAQRRRNLESTSPWDFKGGERKQCLRTRRICSKPWPSRRQSPYAGSFFDSSPSVASAFRALSGVAVELSLRTGPRTKVRLRLASRSGPATTIHDGLTPWHILKREVFSGIQLTPEQEERIQAIVNAGAFGSTREALDAAVAVEIAAASGFDGSQQERERLLLEGLNSETLQEEEFWNSIDTETNALIAEHNPGVWGEG